MSFRKLLLFILLLPATALAQADHAAPAIPLAPGVHLFIDDYLIDSQQNLTRVTQHPDRLAEPIVTGKEDDNYQPYVTVVRDPQTKKFRMWYGVPAAAPKIAPSQLAYIESDDGIHFQRPHRVLDNPGGMNIQFGASVIDDGPNVADAARRFKFGWYCQCANGNGLMVATSPDGLKWTPIVERGPVLLHNHDINNIFHDTLRNHYVATISTMQKGNWQGERRVTMQSFSDDLIHWSKPWNVLVPDEKDEGETQFYAMGGLINRGDLTIGLVKVLRDEIHDDPNDPDAHGIGYTTLAYTRDGIHWTRDREPFMPRNPTVGAFDHAMTWGDCQLFVGNELYIYYGGYLHGHKTRRFIERQIGIARLPVDRYVARQAGDHQATLITKPLQLNGKLTINAKIEGGLRVRLKDLDGNALDPQFPPIQLTGDSIAHPLSWPAIHQTVSLEFQLTRASLYGFAVADE